MSLCGCHAPRTLVRTFLFVLWCDHLSVSCFGPSCSHTHTRRHTQKYQQRAKILCKCQTTVCVVFYLLSTCLSRARGQRVETEILIQIKKIQAVMYMCVRVKHSCFLYNQCVKAPVPISMIIYFSAWAQTATLIQFISSLLTGSEIQGQGEVHTRVYQNWDSEFSLMMEDYFSCRVNDFGNHVNLLWTFEYYMRSWFRVPEIKTSGIVQRCKGICIVLEPIQILSKPLVCFPD